MEMLQWGTWSVSMVGWGWAWGSETSSPTSMILWFNRGQTQWAVGPGAAPLSGVEHSGEVRTQCQCHLFLLCEGGRGGLAGDQSFVVPK